MTALIWRLMVKPSLHSRGVSPNAFPAAPAACTLAKYPKLYERKRIMDSYKDYTKPKWAPAFPLEIPIRGRDFDAVYSA